MEKIIRRSTISTRHSRFGAFIKVRRQVDNSSAITSMPNFKLEDMTKFNNQRKKPKPQKRWFGQNKGSIFNEKIGNENLMPTSEEDKNLQRLLKKFTEDF